MGISYENYDSWLDTTLLRFIYATELQGQNRDCYTKDLMVNGHYNRDIYPHPHTVIPPLISTLDPDKGFVNEKGESNLDLGDNTIPFMNLIEGLTFLNEGLEKYLA